MKRESPNRWLPLIAALLLTGVVAAMFGQAWDALPEPMASHWGPSGKPDGAAPKALLVTINLAPVWILAGIAMFTKSRPALATLITLSAALTGLFSVMAWSVVDLNQGVAEWRLARSMPMSHLSLLALATLGPGIAASVALRPLFRKRDPSASAPSLTLTGGERAVWLGSAHNRWLWLLVVPVPVLVFVRHTTPVASAIALVTALTSLILADAFSSVRVTADRNGVDIRCGRLGWIRRRVALTDVDHAEVFDLVPLAHGGWGYRGSLRLMKRAAIVVRGGSALRLALRNGKQLSVTVDDADSGASLINGMVRHT